MKEPEQATVPLRCRGRMGPALVKITCVQPPRIRLQEEHEGKEVVVHLLSGGLRSDLAHTEALSQATKAKQSSVVRTELLTYYEPIDSVGVLFNERFEALMVLAPFVKQSSSREIFEGPRAVSLPLSQQRKVTRYDGESDPMAAKSASPSLCRATKE